MNRGHASIFFVLPLMGILIWPVHSTAQEPNKKNVSINASNPIILEGGSATLKWIVIGNHETIEIFPNVGSNLPPSGSIAISPTQTTTYTLRVVYADGSVLEATSTIAVLFAEDKSDKIVEFLVMVEEDGKTIVANLTPEGISEGQIFISFINPATGVSTQSTLNPGDFSKVTLNEGIQQPTQQEINNINSTNQELTSINTASGSEQVEVATNPNTDPTTTNGDNGTAAPPPPTDLGSASPN